MSNANIKLIQDIYAAFGRSDIPAVLDRLAEDVSWGMVGREQDFPAAGIRNGKSGAGQFFQLLRDAQEITNFTPRRFVAAEDMVLAWGDCDWIMCRNGVSGHNEWLHVFTIRDGKVSAWRGYQDTALLSSAYHAGPSASRVA